MSYLIIECDHDGDVFCYHESKSHHRKTEPMRAGRLDRRDWLDVDKDCHLAPGQYMVVPVVEV
jgi:hypothetical protein